MTTALLALFLILAPASQADPSPDAATNPQIVTEEISSSDEEVGDEETQAEPIQIPQAISDDIDSDDEAVQAVSVLVTLLLSEQWIPAMALAIMLTIFLARRQGWLDRIPSELIPWTSMGLGVLVAAATAILEGQPIPAALLHGAVAGLASSGLWSAAGKQILTKHQKGTSEPT